MSWIDAIAVYWFAIKLLLYVAGSIILVSSVDDFLIDLNHWLSRLLPSRRRRRNTNLPMEVLHDTAQKPIAIMVPAWHEAPVIGHMAELAARRFDYANFDVFVGTYPNDPDTQREVDKITAQYANVHKVVCKDPGPTTKADCINNIIAYIFAHEKTTNREYAAFIFHDAEDVVHELELKVYNYWIDKYDLVQLPVVPLRRPWWWITAGHYNDEFVEYHSKDLLVRRDISGHVPSAGVGTAFSRRAIVALERENAGRIFNTGSLTEDYDISFQLLGKGFREIFVLQELPRDHWWIRTHVSIRAYFPHGFHHAVRQKSRWIVGIVFQGWRNIGWQGSLRLRYFLYRDRKAVLTNPVNAIAYYMVLNITGMAVLHSVYEDAISFPALIYDDSWLMGLIFVNGFFFLNRCLQRFYFVSRTYGLLEGLLSAPRMVWGNVINFFAFMRAVNQFRSASSQGRDVIWDKTTHEFPDVAKIK